MCKNSLDQRIFLLVRMKFWKKTILVIRLSTRGYEQWEFPLHHESCVFRGENFRAIIIFTILLLQLYVLPALQFRGKCTVSTKIIPPNENVSFVQMLMTWLLSTFFAFIAFLWNTCEFWEIIRIFVTFKLSFTFKILLNLHSWKFCHKTFCYKSFSSLLFEKWKLMNLTLRIIKD